MSLRRALAALSAVLLALAGVVVTAAPAQAATNIPIAGASNIDDLVINKAGTTAYVVDRSANKIYFFDLATKTVTTSVSVNSTPDSVALNPAETRLYVAHYSGSRPWTTVIDTADATVVTTVNDPARGPEVPITVAVNPSGSQAWVGNYDSTGAGSISVIDAATNTIARHIATGTAITSLSFRADGAYAYAVASQVGKVFVISTSTYAITEIAVAGARAVEVSPTAPKAYIAGGGFLRVLDTATNTLNPDVKVPVGPSTSDIAFTADGKRAYVVGNSSTSTLDVIDAERDEIAAGTTPIAAMYPQSIAIDPNDSSRVYAAAGYARIVEYSVLRSFESPVSVSIAPTQVRPGVVLTASIDGDAKPTPTSYAYQWFVGESPVSGATSTTFTVPESAIGKKVQVRVTPTLADYVSSTGVGTSTTATVTAKAFSASPTPTIDGTPVVDGTLTAVAGTWDSAATLGYEWRADGVPLTVTGKTLSVTADLWGKTITVVVTGTASGYETTPRTSEGVGPVASAVFTEKPALGITGTARVGETLSANVTKQAVPEPSGYEYQWLVDGEPVAGATSKDLVLDPSFVDLRVSVVATPVRKGYSPAGMSGTATSTVIEAGHFTVDPSIEILGTPEVGKSLEASIVTGATPTATAYTYQWFADDVAIPGATSTTLELSAALVGTSVSVKVSPVLGGYDASTGEASARITGTVAPGSFVALPSVEISGDVEVGATVKANITTAAAPAPTGYTYQWLADGQPIAGASTQTFSPTADLLGAVLTVTVLPQLAGYDSASGRATSGGSEPVGIGSFTNPALVEVSGLPQVGQTLTAAIVLGASPAPTSYTYQWYAGGTPIDGATTASLVLTAAQSGQSVTVVATPQLAGYDGQTGRGKSGATPGVASLGLSLTSVNAGGDVLVTGSGLTPGAVYSVQLFSTPVVLGTVTADASGAFSRTFAIPADTAPGVHEVKLFDAAGIERASLALTILAAPGAVGAAAGGATGLSSTGGTIELGWLAFGAGSLILGAFLIAARRRLASRS